MKKIVLALNLILFSTNLSAQFGQANYLDTTLTAADEIVVADITNDGKNDILITIIPDYYIGYYKNLGNNNFSGLIDISINTNSPRSPLVFDADLDGDNDLLVHATSPGMRYFENNGDGTFQAPVTILTGSTQPHSLCTGDIENDGDLDIFTVGTFTAETAWYENLGGGSFSSKNIISTSEIYPSEINAADMDNDSDLDLVVSCSNTNNRIGWFENLGSSTFSSYVTLTTNVNTISDIELIDLDNNGFIDILINNVSTNRIAYFNNYGAGTFAPLQSINPTAATIRGVEANDFDSDGDVDILGLFTYLCLDFYQNIGNENFITPVKLIDSTSLFKDFMIGDLDGDFDLDIACLKTDAVLTFENVFDAFKISGNVFFDDNQNSIFDANDYYLQGIKIQANSNNQFGFTNADGKYNFALPGGYNIIVPDLQNIWTITTDSISYNRTLSISNPVVDSLNFGVYPDSIFIDMNLVLVNNLPRCNTVARHLIEVTNNGTTNINGTVELVLDPSVFYVSADPLPDAINGNIITWNFDSLRILEKEIILVDLQMPPFSGLGVVVGYTMNVNAVDFSGSLVSNKSKTEYSPMLCAFDPNEKLVDPKGIGTQGFINSDEWLEYTIYFQNTGNDTAFNILVTDTLDINLDWSSFSVLAESHNVFASVNNGIAKFNFENIYLPDSNVNEVESHGFVRFKIKLTNNLVSFDEILNSANIYFDYNEPIITNTVTNTICETFPIQPINLSDSIVWEGCKGTETILMAQGSGILNWYDSLGNLLSTGNLFSEFLQNSTTILVKDSTCFQGNSYLEFTILIDTIDTQISYGNATITATDTNQISYQWINCISGSPVSGANAYSFVPLIEGDYALIISNTFCTDTSECISISFLGSENLISENKLSKIWPNPFDKHLNLELNSNSEIRIFDYSGKICYSNKLLMGKIDLDLGFLENGIYFIDIANENQVERFKVIKLD